MAINIKTGLLRCLRENYMICLIVPLIFCCGFFFGTLGAKELTDPQVKELVEYVEGFVQDLPNTVVDGSLETKHALKVNLKTLFYAWFLGLTIIGIPLTLAVVFTRGFILGFTVGFLVNQKAFQGMMVVILTVLPQSLLFVPVIILAGVSSIIFSLNVIKGRFVGRTLNLSKHFFSYTFVFMILGIFASLAALIQGYVSPSLVRAVFYFT